MSSIFGNLPTCIQRCDIKSAKSFGKFYIVGSVPGSCLKADGSKVTFDTEADALKAVIAAGAERIQLADCSFYKPAEQLESDRAASDLLQGTLL